MSIFSLILFICRENKHLNTLETAAARDLEKSCKPGNFINQSGASNAITEKESLACVCLTLSE